MRPRNQQRAKQPGHHAAKSNLIGNDQIFQINERANDQAGNENGVGRGQQRGDGAKFYPEGREERRREQFHHKIARRTERHRVPRQRRAGLARGGLQVLPGDQGRRAEDGQ